LPYQPFFIFSLQIAEVVLGEHDLSSDPDCTGCPFAQRFDINPDDVIVHEWFDQKNMFVNGSDLALVRLPRKAVTVIKNSEERVLPICLPSSEDEIKRANEFWVI
jgi:hypothetical protein